MKAEFRVQIPTNIQGGRSRHAFSFFASRSNISRNMGIRAYSLLPLLRIRSPLLILLTSLSFGFGQLRCNIWYFRLISEVRGLSYSRLSFIPDPRLSSA